MKKTTAITIVILAVMAASATRVTSHEGRHNNEQHEQHERRGHRAQKGKHLERMKKHLGLTDDQVRRIREIDSVSRADRKAKVMDVLTAEQRTKLEQHQQKRQNNKHSR
ncbi:MAG TPA: hypothetical protein DIS79_04800 [Bacteroidetes bacterium]|nr:hypothetical protein [Bacteroidota bacterium]HRK04371.1 hypothetical protein [Chlorobiota bacterium]